jgi:ferritin-like metal-binding protein YciE
MNASEKLARYLNEAKTTEDALTRVLQSQIAMTPAGDYRDALTTHLDETRDHSRRVAHRVRELIGTPSPLRFAAIVAEEAVGQTLALAKAPLDLLRGSGGEEKVLKNAKDAAATEALEIATYTAIERLATTVGDERTAELARGIRDDEQAMLDRILREIPSLTDAVARADLEGDPSYDVTRTGAADAVKRAVGSVADTEDANDLAIRGYDQLTVDEINAKLPELSQAELAEVDSYERRNQDRVTVLNRVETLRGDEPWPGYDELTVTEIDKALAGRSDDQVRALRTYEAAHKNRTGVIKATERQLA